MFKFTQTSKERGKKTLKDETIIYLSHKLHLLKLNMCPKSSSIWRIKTSQRKNGSESRTINQFPHPFFKSNHHKSRRLTHHFLKSIKYPTPKATQKQSTKASLSPLPIASSEPSAPLPKKQLQYSLFQFHHYK